MWRVAAESETSVDMSGWEAREVPYRDGGPPSPVGGGRDPLHLAGHTLFGVAAREDGNEPVLLRDGAAGRACLILDSYGGWYRTLALSTMALAPPPGGKSWRVEVVCRPIGHLGVFRHSRLTGRWFAGHHRVHELGVPSP
jgi:hypothetical protein